MAGGIGVFTSVVLFLWGCSGESIDEVKSRIGRVSDTLCLDRMLTPISRVW